MRSFLKSALAALSINAALYSPESAHSGMVSAKKNTLDTLIFYLLDEIGDEVPLLEVVDNLDQFFDSEERLAFPE